jgi:hypothetical protein
MKNNPYGLLREAGAGAGDASGGGSGSGEGNQGDKGSLLSGGGSGNPVAGDWRAGLPDDIKADPTLKDIKDIPSLAKSYVHAQRLVGTDKIPKPQANWKPEQWAAFYDAAGRPKTPQDYKFADGTIPKEFPVDEQKMGATLKLMHDLGLRNDQAEALLKHYGQTALDGQKQMTGQRDAARQAGTDALKKEWGDQFTANVDIARGAMMHFGGEEIATLMEETGLGNDPRMVKFLAKVGQSMMDDSARGQGNGLIVTNQTQAQGEINALKQDKDFLAVLTNKSAPGHQEAVDRWTRLHAIANPSK